MALFAGGFTSHVAVFTCCRQVHIKALRKRLSERLEQQIEETITASCCLSSSIPCAKISKDSMRLFLFMGAFDGLLSWYLLLSTSRFFSAHDVTWHEPQMYANVTCGEIVPPPPPPPPPPTTATTHHPPSDVTRTGLCFTGSETSVLTMLNALIYLCQNRRHWSNNTKYI